jgi:hypothetical protein
MNLKRCPKTGRRLAARVQQTGGQISVNSDQNAEAIGPRFRLQQEDPSQNEQTEIYDTLANFLGERTLRMGHGDAATGNVNWNAAPWE